MLKSAMRRVVWASLLGARVKGAEEWSIAEDVATGVAMGVIKWLSM